MLQDEKALLWCQKQLTIIIWEVEDGAQVSGRWHLCEKAERGHGSLLAGKVQGCVSIVVH